MNNDERAIDDGDVPDDLPEDSLDADHFLNSYPDSREDDEELEEESVGRSGQAVEEADSPAISDDELEETDSEASSEDELTAMGGESAAEEAATDRAVPPPVFNNFMDALYPKRAPAARNARIIRRFDLEAAKYDPRPAAAPTPVLTPAPAAAVAPVAAETKKEPLSREEARALRNRSLRAAAGLD
jgi:hypothetical protein